MRRPPSFRTVTQHPATGAIAILSIIVTLAFWSGAVDVTPLMVTPHTATQPWRLLTSTLLHGDVMHLVFNLFWLWTFGTAVEGAWGTIRSLAIYSFLGVGSSAAEFALFEGGIGLSGIGYGLFGLLYVLSRRDARFADAVDKPTTQLFAFWFVLCIVMTAAGIWNIANVAHGSGFVFGFGLGHAICAAAPVRRIAASATAALFALALAGTGPLRPLVNVGEPAGALEAYDGYQALQEERWEEARDLLERATVLRSDDAASWYNLGYAKAQLGDLRGAKNAFQRVLVLDPGSVDASEMIAWIDEQPPEP